MRKKVLIVDDDRIMLRLAEKKLKKHAEMFTVITAGDGLQAIQKLKAETISLVVTDLNMPEMDGFALLAHLSENYPDIPVIILTAYSSQTSRKAVLKSGAAGFMEKPFVVETLARKISEALNKESEGGILQTVPLDMFLQLVEMEQKTCTIRVVNKISNAIGVLFFKSGDLMDARIKDVKGIAAAYKIFSWDKVALSIQDACVVEKKQIKDDLQAILMEAMRLKDEREEAGTDPGSAEEIELEFADEEIELETAEIDTAAPEPVESIRTDPIREKLSRLGSEKKYMKAIIQDKRWDALLTELTRIGSLFDSGKLKACYLNCGEITDLIVLPGENTSVVSMTARSPRDRILKVLSE